MSLPNQWNEYPTLLTSETRYHPPYHHAAREVQRWFAYPVQKHIPGASSDRKEYAEDKTYEGICMRIYFPGLSGRLLQLQQRGDAYANIKNRK